MLIALSWIPTSPNSNVKPNHWSGDSALSAAFWTLRCHCLLDFFSGSVNSRAIHLLDRSTILQHRRSMVMRCLVLQATWQLLDYDRQRTYLQAGTATKEELFARCTPLTIYPRMDYRLRWHPRVWMSIHKPEEYPNKLHLPWCPRWGGSTACQTWLSALHTDNSVERI